MKFPTRGNATLDLFLTNMGDHFATPEPYPPFALSNQFSQDLRNESRTRKQGNTSQSGTNGTVTRYASAVTLGTLNREPGVYPLPLEDNPDYIRPALERIADSNQFGTVSGSSTVLALLSMIHEWLQATDGNSASVRVFLFDYRKAFDFIDHGTLAAKLKEVETPNSIVN